MIKIVEKDLFDSNADIICHQVNCQGKMNSGVAKQVRERFPSAYRDYMAVYRSRNLKLGMTITSYHYESDRMICHFASQDKYGYDGKRYTDYEAFRNCLKSLVEGIKYSVESEDYETTIAFPYKIGCDRGGGDWDIIYKMIEEELKDYDVEICVLPNTNM